MVGQFCWWRLLPILVAVTMRRRKFLHELMVSRRVFRDAQVGLDSSLGLGLGMADLRLGWLGRRLTASYLGLRYFWNTGRHLI